MTYDEWLQYGREHSYIGPIVCATHDGTPTTEAEDAEFDDGGDPCLPIARVYVDHEERIAVEANHGPSVWRRS